MSHSLQKFISFQIKFLPTPFRCYVSPNAHYYIYTKCIVNESVLYSEYGFSTPNLLVKWKYSFMNILVDSSSATFHGTLFMVLCSNIQASSDE